MVRKNNCFILFGLIVFLLLIFTGGAVKAKSNSAINELQIKVDADNTKGVISRMLTGVNMSYYFDRDLIWSDGKIAGYLKEANVGLMRYPGGVETSRFHWEKPEVDWYMDGWDVFVSKDFSGGDAYMSTDDFIRQCRAVGAEPLIGVNIQSGIRFDRIDDSIAEAARWVKYCKDKNYNVKYWYLDNEPYFGSNVDAMTIEEYVGYIKKFVPAMKAVDPNIKTVADWHSLLSNPECWKEYEYMISEANEYIDIIDVHLYWAWGYCTWDLWLKDNPMKVRNWCGDCPDQRYIGPSIAEEIRSFYERIQQMGVDIKLASLEWNIAPNRNTEFSRYQHALMQAEMLMQFIEGGLHMACMWPLTWNRGDLGGDFRAILDQQRREPTPSHKVFKLFSNLLGQRRIETKVDHEFIRHLAAVSRDRKTLWVYLLNKKGTNQEFDTNIDIKDFVASRARAFSFMSLDLSSNVADIREISIKQNTNGGNWNIGLPPYSLTMLEFHK